MVIQKRSACRWHKRAGFCCLLAILLMMLGARAAFAQSDPAVVGQWSEVTNWPLVAINAALLPNGTVLAYQHHIWPTDPKTVVNQASVWDPLSNTFTDVPLSPGPKGDTTDIFCSGLSFLPDGRLLVTGGHKGINGVGSRSVNLFDFSTNTWSRAADMNAGRWYPSNVALASGEVLVLAGSKDAKYSANNLPQVWTGMGWRSLTSALQNLPLYPYLHLAPNGKVFMSGPKQTTQYLDTKGTGSWKILTSRQFGNRDYGASVLYDNGKVLMAGGGDPPTASAEVIDLNAAKPAWRTVAPMAFARRHLNATLLPDGTVLVTGGTSSPGFNEATQSVLSAELWDPTTETWTTLASMTERRLYHSTALLLPDGRVLSAGGGQPAASTSTDGEQPGDPGTVPDADHYTAEIYSPPYLFKSPRPAIATAPASVIYGQTFFVETPDAASIANVNWIRLSAVTHARNMDQRINRLIFTQGEGGLNVTAPSNANLCPPGYYMLFLLNGDGVPSVASIVQISRGVPAVQQAPIADAYVRAGAYADTNFGAESRLIVKKTADSSTADTNRCAYFQFDLTGLTQAPLIATLALTVDGSSNPAGSTENVRVYAVDDSSWTETGLTWNNAPGLNRANFTSTGTLLTSVLAPLSPGLVTIDLTGFVQANLGKVVTLQLMDAAKENRYLVFRSREAASGPPVLNIIY